MAYILQEIRTLEEDMTAFPDKTEKEVKEARSLWTSGMIKISSSEGYEFVPRTLIGRLPPSFAALTSSSRSWPCIQLKDAVDKEYTGVESKLWEVLRKCYLKYVYTLDISIFGSDNPLYVALFGEALNIREVFNLGMTKVLEGPDFPLRTNQELYLLEGLLPPMSSSLQALKEAYSLRKLTRYLIDGIVWLVIFGRPSRNHESTFRYHGFIKEYVEDLKVETLLRATGPIFPPYHISNRHKYLLSEPEDVSEAVPVKVELDVPPPAGIKRERSPDSDSYSNKNPRKDYATASIKREGSPDGEIYGNKNAPKDHATRIAAVVVKEEVACGPHGPAQLRDKVTFGAVAHEHQVVKKEEPCEMFMADKKLPKEVDIERKNKDDPDQLQFDAKTIKKEVIDVDAEPEVHGTRSRRASSKVRRNIFDFIDDLD